jgi:hypothetical protein
MILLDFLILSITLKEKNLKELSPQDSIYFSSILRTGLTVYVLRKIDRDARGISGSALPKDLSNGPIAVVDEFARTCNPLAGCPVDAEEITCKVKSDRGSIIRENAPMGDGESDRLS